MTKNREEEDDVHEGRGGGTARRTRCREGNEEVHQGGRGSGEEGLVVGG